MATLFRHTKVRRAVRVCCTEYEYQSKDGFFLTIRERNEVPFYKCGRCLVNEFGLLPDEVLSRKRDPFTKQVPACGVCGAFGRVFIFRASVGEKKLECGRRCSVCARRIGGSNGEGV